MDNLTISNVKRISINGDPTRVIEIDPDDILLAERFYKVYPEILAKQKELDLQSKELDAKMGEKDENGVPLAAGEGIAFTKEACMYMREKIDYIFGEGTSQTALGDSMNALATVQLIEGLTKFINPARTKKIKKYTEAKDEVMNEHTDG